MAFDFPELSLNLQRAHGRRIALRPASLSDAWPLFHATRNPLFNKHLLWTQPEQDAAVLERMDLIVDAAARGRMTALSAVVKATGEWIGLFRFLPYREDPHAVEMGVWLHDKFWHGRYSLEIGRLCVDAAFSLSTVERLMAASVPDNRGSCSLMLAVGMAPTGLSLREAENGDTLLLQEYGITREQWSQRRSSAQAGFDVFKPPSQARSAAAHKPREAQAAGASADKPWDRPTGPAWSEPVARQTQAAARA
jgi:RimJ/RimL family protein N-acetyltransferase